MNILNSLLTLLPIIIGLEYFLLREEITGWPITFFIGSILSFGISVLLGLVIYQPRDVYWINPSKFYYEYYSESEDELKEQAAVDIAAMVNKLKVQCDNKSALLKYMQIMCMIGILSMLISFGLILL